MQTVVYFKPGMLVPMHLFMKQQRASRNEDKDESQRNGKCEALHILWENHFSRIKKIIYTHQKHNMYTQLYHRLFACF